MEETVIDLMNPLKTKDFMKSFILMMILSLRLGTIINMNIIKASKDADAIPAMNAVSPPNTF